MKPGMVAHTYNQSTVRRLRQEDLGFEASLPAQGLPTPCHRRGGSHGPAHRPFSSVVQAL